MEYEQYKKISAALQYTKSILFERVTLSCAEESIKQYHIRQNDEAIKTLKEVFNTPAKLIQVPVTLK